MGVGSGEMGDWARGATSCGGCVGATSWGGGGASSPGRCVGDGVGSWPATDVVGDVVAASPTEGAGTDLLQAAKASAINAKMAICR